MSGVVCKVNPKVRASASSQNAAYITRESGTYGDEDGIYLHNLDELRGEDYQETRTNFISYAEARQDDELTRRQRGGGQSRTHYRCVMSWDRKEETAKARQVLEEHLEKHFPSARAVVAVHQDTEHTHAHVWIDARLMDGKKLHLSRADYRKIDEQWAKTYAKHYGKEYERDHLNKKAETREHKRARAQGKSSPKPTRASRATKPQEHAERERRNYGAYETRPGGDQRGATGRDQKAARSRAGATGNGKPSATRGEREIDRYAGQSERTSEAARGALQQAERLRGGADRGLSTGGNERARGSGSRDRDGGRGR